MTPSSFIQIGMKLFGRGWQTDIAEQLGVAPRTVRRWIAGERSMPEDISLRVHRVIDKRALDLQAAERIASK